MKLPQPDLFQQSDHSRLNLRSGQGAVDFQRLANYALHPHTWIQRRPGVLEDGLHRSFVFLASFFFEVKRIIALKQYLALRRLFEKQHHLGSCGFSAARLAYQSVSLTRFNFKRDTVDCFEHCLVTSKNSRTHRKVLFQVRYSQEDIAIVTCAHSLLPATGSFSLSQHAEIWPSPTSNVSGYSSRHRSIT